jgi:hypothetical protein
MSKTALKVLLSPLFILGLFLLLLNDFYLKAAYGNFLTGKLSDVAGLFIFPLFFVAFVPKYKNRIYVLTTLGFVFWKLSISQSAIDLWNSLEIMRVGRIEDPTDLLALLVLFPSYVYAGVYAGYSAKNLRTYPIFRRTAASFMIALSVFAFTATSFEEDRSFVYGKEYDLHLTKEEFDARLRKIEGIGKVDIDHYDFMPENQLSYTFSMPQKYCESNIQVSMNITPHKDQASFELLSLRFWCKEKPAESVEDELLSIFEREVIDKLGPNDR